MLISPGIETSRFMATMQVESLEVSQRKTALEKNPLNRGGNKLFVNLFLLPLWIGI
jgi:hypothetical protein